MRVQVLKLLFNLSFSVIEREKLADTDLAEKLIPMLEIKVRSCLRLGLVLAPRIIFF